MLKIWVAICLVGLANSVFFGVNQHNSVFSNSEYTLSDFSPNGDHDASIFSTVYPFLLIAETNQNEHSEIDPQTSVYTYRRMLQRKTIFISMIWRY
jgi:hypothetical protein